MSIQHGQIGVNECNRKIDQKSMALRRERKGGKSSLKRRKDDAQMIFQHRGQPTGLIKAKDLTRFSPKSILAVHESDMLFYHFIC